MRKILISGVAFLGLTLLAGNVSASSDTRKSKKLYKLGMRDIRKGLYITAYDKLSEAYWLDPFNDRALDKMDNITTGFKKNLSEWCEYDFEQRAYAKGFLFYTQGNYGKAIQEWEKVLTVKENPEVRGYYEYVREELKKGMKKDQLQFGGKVKEDRKKALEKKNKKKRSRKGKTVKKQKVVKKKAPSKPAPPKVNKPKADELYNEGLKQYSQGYLKLAIASWKKTLKYNPGHTRAKRAMTRTKKMLEKK